jgi:hypothetical protein
MTTPITEHEINSLKHRVSILEKNEAVDKYAGYIADAVEHLSAFSSNNRLDAIKGYLNKLVEEVTDITAR